MKRLALLPIALLLLAACGSDKSTAAGGSGGGDTQKVDITLTDAGCNPTEVSVKPGKVTFRITNDGADAVSELYVYKGNSVVGEREGLTPGLSGELEVTLQEGEYRLYCLGGTTQANAKLLVSASGSSGSPAPGSEGAAGGGCLPAGDPATASSRLAVQLVDYAIKPGATTVAAGKVSIDGTNLGQQPHEVVIVKGVKPADLPYDDKGAVDEAKLPDGAVVGELEEFSAGKACSSVVDLAPGQYTLFCNVVAAPAGGHAKLGMVTELTVA